MKNSLKKMAVFLVALGGVLTCVWLLNNHENNTSQLTEFFVEANQLLVVEKAGVEIKSPVELGKTQVKVQKESTVISGQSTIKKIVDIQPEFDENLNAQLSFQYKEEELNDLDENNLILYSSNDKGVTWKAHPRTKRDPVNNTLYLDEVKHFSLWTAASMVASFTVTNLADSGAGSLREAMTNANASNGPHIIDFSSGLTGQIELASDLPIINKSDITIDGGGVITISVAGTNYNLARRPFRTAAGANGFTVRGFTVKNVSAEIFRLEGNPTNVLIEDIIAFNEGGNFIDYAVYFIGNANGLTVRNFELKNRQNVGAGNIHISGTATNVLIDNFDYSESGGGSSRAFQVVGIANNITIQNCDWDNYLSTSTDDGDYGVLFNTHATNVTIDNCNMMNHEIHSIYFANTSTNVSVTNSTFDNSQGHGNAIMLRFLRDVDTLLIEDVTINCELEYTTSGANHGIYFDWPQENVTLRRVTINDADEDGISLHGLTTNLLIDSCTIAYPNGLTSGNHDGIQFHNNRVRTNVEIKNSTFDGAGRAGLIFDPSNATTEFHIHDNVFKNIAGSPGHGIYVAGSGGSKDIIIEHNEIFDNSGSGIHIQRADNVQISENSIYNNKGIGIENSLGDGNCDYQQKDGDAPILTNSVVTGANAYDLTFTLPSFCAGDCDVEIFINDACDNPYQGRQYLQTFTGLSSGSQTVSISCASGECLDEIKGTWSATLTAPGCTAMDNTSEFSAPLALIQKGPGGVTANLQFWLKGDAGTYTTAAGLFTATLGDAWLDQSGNGRHVNSVSSSPALVEVGMNFNPVAEFVYPDYFTITGAPNNTFYSSFTEGEVFTTLASFPKANASGSPFYLGGAGGGLYTAANDNITEGFGTNGLKGFNASSLSVVSGGGTVQGSTPLSTERPNIYGIHSVTNDYGLSFNGAVRYQNNTNTVSFNAGGNLHIGARPSGIFQGEIGELILFDQKLTSVERQKVNSYLAIKYGVTLDQETPTNYISSAGTVVWDATANSGFADDIAGIGYDFDSDLMQRQSRSENKNAEMAIYLGDQSAGLPASNKLNIENLTTDQSFLIWGHNGSSAAYAKEGYAPNSFSPSNPYLITSRVWKVQETGTVGTVTVHGPGAATHMLVHNNADMTSGSPTEIPTVDDGNGNRVAVVDLTDGQYLAFGREVVPFQGICNGGQFVNWESYDAGCALGSMQTLSGEAVKVTATGSMIDIEAAVRFGTETTHSPKTSSNNLRINNDSEPAAGGSGPHDYKFEFSIPLQDPVMHLFSVGNGSQHLEYTFTDDNGNPLPFDIESTNNTSNFFETSSNVLFGKEGNGTIRFQGNVSTINVEVTFIVGNAPESWTGITFGEACPDAIFDSCPSPAFVDWTSNTAGEAIGTVTNSEGDDIDVTLTGSIVNACCPGEFNNPTNWEINSTTGERVAIDEATEPTGAGPIEYVWDFSQTISQPIMQFFSIGHAGGRIQYQFFNEDDIPLDFFVRHTPNWENFHQTNSYTLEGEEGNGTIQFNGSPKQIKVQVTHFSGATSANYTSVQLIASCPAPEPEDGAGKCNGSNFAKWNTVSNNSVVGTIVDPSGVASSITGIGSMINIGYQGYFNNSNSYDLPSRYADRVAIDNAAEPQQTGTGPFNYTWTISNPIEDLEMYVFSMGNGGQHLKYTFTDASGVDIPFTILSTNHAPNFNKTAGNELFGKEGNGIIRFDVPVTVINMDVTFLTSGTREYWTGVTFAKRCPESEAIQACPAPKFADFTGNTAGTATAEIDDGNGGTIDVDVTGSMINSGYPGQFRNVDIWDPVSITSDRLAIDNAAEPAQSGSTGPFDYVWDFSAALVDPIFNFYSIGRSNVEIKYTFTDENDNPLTFCVRKTNNWENFHQIFENVLIGREGHGSIQFLGSPTQINMQVDFLSGSTSEYYTSVQLIGGCKAAPVCTNTSTFTCPAGDPIDLTAYVPDYTSGGIWSDEDGTGVDISDSTAVDMSSLAGGEYTFRYLFADGDSCHNVLVEMTDPVSAPQLNDIEVCEGGSTQIIVPIDADKTTVLYEQTFQALNKVYVRSKCTGSDPSSCYENRFDELPADRGLQLDAGTDFSEWKYWTHTWLWDYGNLKFARMLDQEVSLSTSESYTLLPGESATFSGQSARWWGWMNGDDYVKFAYIIDGVETEFSNRTGAISGHLSTEQATYTNNTASAQTIGLRVRVKNSWNEAHYIDNLKIIKQLAPPTYTFYSDGALTTVLASGHSYDPETAAGTTETVYVTCTQNGCESLADTVVITVAPNTVEPMAGEPVFYCAGGSNVDLTENISNYQTGGTWSDDHATGVTIGDGTNIDVSGLADGSYHFTYTLNGTAPCPGESAVVTVNIGLSPGAPEVEDILVCDGGSTEIIVPDDPNREEVLYQQTFENRNAVYFRSKCTGSDPSTCHEDRFDLLASDRGLNLDPGTDFSSMKWWWHSWIWDYGNLKFGRLQDEEISLTTDVMTLLPGEVATFSGQSARWWGWMNNDDYVKFAYLVGGVETEFADRRGLISGHLATSQATYENTTNAPVNIQLRVKVKNSWNEGHYIDNLKITKALNKPTYNFYSDAALTTMVGSGQSYDPMTAAGSSDLVYVTCINNGCETVADTVSITVAPNNVDPMAGETAYFCTGGSSLNLTDYITDFVTGGTWTDDEATGVTLGAGTSVDVSGLADGIYNFTYTLAGTAPCLGESAVVSVNIGSDNGPQAVDLTDTTISNTCPITTVDLTSLQDSVQGNPTIVWSTDSDSSDGLSSTVADSTMVSVAGTYYAYQMEGACISPASAAVSVTVTSCNIPTAPGGVTTNLALWLKADAGMTVGGDNSVDNWIDQSSNAFDYDDSDSNIGPDFIDGADHIFNYNPYVDFTSATRTLKHPTAATTVLSTTQSMVGVFYKKANNQTLLAFDAGNNVNQGGLLANGLQIRGNVNVYQYSNTAASLANNQVYLVGGADDTPGNGTADVVLDGKLMPNATAQNAPNLMNSTSGTSLLGRGLNTATSSLAAEFIVFDKKLSAMEWQQVNSYLAIKYGLTLDQSTPLSYLNSSGGTVWTAGGGYDNNIAGIAREDAQGLYQKQSKSIENSRFVAIGKDSVGLINNANAGVLADGTFLIWGNDGDNLSPVNSLTGTAYKYMNRTWLVEETGDAGTVEVRVPRFATPNDMMVLIRSTDVNFDNSDEVIQMTQNADGTVSADIDFNDGDYFTFARTFVSLTADNDSDGIPNYIECPASVVAALDGSIDEVRSWYGAGNGSFIINPTKTDPINNINFGVNGMKRTELGDVNGDGIDDLVAALGNAATGGPAIRTWIGLGNGKFTATPIITTPTSTNFGASATEFTGIRDVNGDGFSDVVSVLGTSEVAGGAIWAYLSNGNGTFSTIPLESTNLQEVNFGRTDTEQTILGDIDGDGQVDVISALGSLEATNPSTALVYRGTGTGYFDGTPIKTVLTNVDFGLSATEITMTGDVNLDGMDDLVAAVGNSGELRTWLATGAGTFDPIPVITSITNYNVGMSTTEATLMRDINGDGFADVVSSLGSAESDGPAIKVFTSNGDGSFTTTPIISNGIVDVDFGRSDTEMTLIGVVGVDTDGDGIADCDDLDTDNDGIPDIVEAGIDPTNPLNTDGDALPNYKDLDSDNDGINDVIEAGGLTDANEDGLADGNDANNDGMIDTPQNNPANNDSDSDPDYIDLDSDGDTIFDIVESGNGAWDTSGNDGVADDVDSDNDGIVDVADTDNAKFGETPQIVVDSDGDGIPDDTDDDDDNDGLLDTAETGDTDGDGIPDRLESNIIDTDGDGNFDYADNNADNEGATDGTSGEEDGVLTGPWNDTDSDGIPDHLDADNGTGADGTVAGAGDSDGDGLSDADECPNGYICPDSDGDGIPDYMDTDSDNDGTSDMAECPSGTCGDMDSDGITDNLESNIIDTDGDGNPDYNDDNADGEGMVDGTGGEEDGLESGVWNDSDNDGIPDHLDADNGSGTGTDIAACGDSDSDGFSDCEECPDGYQCPDVDGNNVPDYMQTSTVRLLCVDPNTETVKLKNFSGLTVDISAYKLCSGFSYTSNLTSATIVSGSLNLAPGAEVELTLNTLTLDETGADLGLYLATGAFSDPAAMVDFTQWGSGGNGRESVAVAKGIWTAGTFISPNENPEFCYSDLNGLGNGAIFWKGNLVTTTVEPGETATVCGDTNFSTDTPFSASDCGGATTGNATPNSGTYTINATTGCIDYTAPANPTTTTDTVCLVICDNLGLCDTSMVVFPIDTTSSVITTTVEPGGMVNVCGNSDWATAAPITASDCSGGTTGSAVPAGGSYTINATTGCIDYTAPAIPSSPTDTVCLVICDGNGICDTTSVVFNINVSSGLQLDVKTFLAGAYDSGSGMMHDSLRSKGLIPMAQPYNDMTDFDYMGTETIAPAVLTVTGTNAIVDWVLVELRSAADPTTVMETRAGLIQRDGDIVDTDGTSSLSFTSADGNYYVAVRHRNHLGCMTENPIALSATATTIDFSLTATMTYQLSDANGSSYARDVVDGVMLLWAGNYGILNGTENRVIYQGSNSDIDEVFFKVLTDNANSDFSPVFIVVSTYDRADGNLDGELIYQGGGADVDPIFFSVGLHPDNADNIPIHVIYEQIPN